jgi:hypothetical protein
MKYEDEYLILKKYTAKHKVCAKKLAYRIAKKSKHAKHAVVNKHKKLHAQRNIARAIFWARVATLLDTCPINKQPYILTLMERKNVNA